MEKVKIALKGRIDSGNAAEKEKEILADLADKGNVALELDARELTYISSAGLRVLLHIKKDYPEMKITGVASDVYEILEMTGFTEIMTVEKAFREISVEGCEQIGQGANGAVYRIDKDNVVKVYMNNVDLEDIKHEREVARLALILGIPTAISYDVVKVGEHYGSVFELLNARSFSRILIDEPEKLDWCVNEYVSLLKKIHSTEVPPGKLPDIKETVMKWAKFVQDYLPEEAGKKLIALVEAVPQDNHMIHGDYHTGNIELQNDEVLLIDMDTLSVGHPIFELASMFNAFYGFSELDLDQVKRFQGFDHTIAREFWRKAMKAYLGTNDEQKIQEVIDKASIIGHTRLIRSSIRRNGLEQNKSRREIEFWKERLLEDLDKYDTLLFDR